MVYLILLIILVAITYGCLLIFAQVDNWINSNIKNVLLGNVIRALVAIVLIPINRVIKILVKIAFIIKKN